MDLLSRNMRLHNAVDKTLRELREILHRRGRLSSRNEALDELCKLLFAHIMSIINGSRGICRKTVLSGNNDNSKAAISLKSFVTQIVSRHMPESLSHEMKPSDFSLIIKPNENQLAIEIIDCFEKLLSKEAVGKISDFEELDILNDVFGKFLADSFINEKELGQYLTPTEIVNFMVSLSIKNMSDCELADLTNPVKCSNVGNILDPSCGVGSFLVDMIKNLRKKVSSIYERDSQIEWLSNMMKNVIVGIDKSERMIRLALANVAMFGVPSVRLYLANSLDRIGHDQALTKSLEGKVRLILTNPPFGAEFKGNDLLKYQIVTRWAKRIPPKVNSEILFIERYLDWLMPGGQLLAIVPDSILTNKGIYKDLRNGLADKVEILSVVSLPNFTFGTAGTTTKTSILHIKKRNNNNSSQHLTYFAICNNIGYNVATKASQKTKIVNGSSELLKILDEYSLPDASLIIGKRVQQVAKTKRWDANYNAFLPKAISERIKYRLDSDVYLSDVAKLSNDRFNPMKCTKKSFQYIEISDVDVNTCMVTTKTIQCSHAPSRARKMVRFGDVLFSTVRPERKIVGVVGKDQDGSICTTGFAVLRPYAIDSLMLAYLLKTDFVSLQVLRNNIGIAYPAIDENCLLDILLPIKKDELAILESSAKDILEYDFKIRNMRKNIKDEVNNLVSNWMV